MKLAPESSCHLTPDAIAAVPPVEVLIEDEFQIICAGNKLTHMAHGLKTIGTKKQIN